MKFHHFDPYAAEHEAHFRAVCEEKAALRKGVELARKAQEDRNVRRRQVINMSQTWLNKRGAKVSLAPVKFSGRDQ